MDESEDDGIEIKRFARIAGAYQTLYNSVV
jgi:hypothetical protein